MKAEEVTEDDLDYLKFRRFGRGSTLARDPKSWRENPRKLYPKGCYCGGHGNHHSNLKWKVKYQKRFWSGNAEI